MSEGPEGNKNNTLQSPKLGAKISQLVRPESVPNQQLTPRISEDERSAIHSRRSSVRSSIRKVENSSRILLPNSAALAASLSSESSKLSACDVMPDELEMKTVRAEDLKVGDIILVKDDEIVPADCFILASGSSLEQTQGGNINPGQCFISTGNLDGERNLKPKMAIKEVEANLGAIVSGKGRDLVIEVDCKDGPILDLYKFDSTLKLVTADR